MFTTIVYSKRVETRLKSRYVVSKGFTNKYFVPKSQEPVNGGSYVVLNFNPNGNK